MRRRQSAFTMWIVCFCALVLIPSCAVAQSSAQDKQVWQAGTIVDVKPHQAPSGTDNSGADQSAGQYDVSVQVGKKIYVVLFSPANGWDQAQYYVGMNRTVLVEGDTLKFNDLLGRTHTMPIISRKDAPEDKPK